MTSLVRRTRVDMRPPLASVTAVVLTFGAVTLQAQGVERQVLRGDRVAIYNLVGSIQLEAGTGSEVQVTVTRQGADGARLRVESGVVRGREALRVIFPDERIVFRGGQERGRWDRTRVRVDRDGTFGDGDRGDWGWNDGVEIVSSGRGFEGYADVRVSVPRGKKVEVFLAAGEATARNVEGDLYIDVQAASVTTSATRGSLELDTGSGDISVTDATGDLTLDSGSGGATLQGIKGRLLRLDTGSGSVRASDVEVDELRGDTGSGRVRLAGVRARDLTLDSGSGSVEVDLLADVDRMRVDAGSGSVTIGVPESLGATVEIDGGRGGIEVDIPMTVTRRSRDSLSGQLGDGRGRLAIDTGSGGVRLRRSGER